MPYDAVLIQPFRDELTRLGFAELRTPAEADAALERRGSSRVADDHPGDRRDEVVGPRLLAAIIVSVGMAEAPREDVPRHVDLRPLHGERGHRLRKLPRPGAGLQLHARGAVLR